MGTKLIRVGPETYRRLAEVAKAEERAFGVVVARALAVYLEAGQRVSSTRLPENRDTPTDGSVVAGSATWGEIPIDAPKARPGRRPGRSVTVRPNANLASVRDHSPAEDPGPRAGESLWEYRARVDGKGKS